MGELYTELHPKLVRHFLGKGVSNKEAAEDLASESLWDLRKYGDKPKEKLKRIIWGIAKNKAIDYFRDQKKIVLFGSAEEIEGKMIPEQLLVRPVERSGRSPIKEDDRIKKVFDEIIKSWGSLDEMRLFLTSPHREIQLITLILQADIESRGVLLSGLRKQLGLRKTGYKKDILINDVYDIPGKSTVEKVPRAARRVLYLRKALGRRSYNRLSQRIYAFLAAAGFCKQVVLIKRITGRGHTISKFPSYIGFTGMLAVLFLDNPRPALETMIGPVEKSNTYSKDFFRDYFFYLFCYVWSIDDCQRRSMTNSKV